MTRHPRAWSALLRRRTCLSSLQRSRNGFFSTRTKGARAITHPRRCSSSVAAADDAALEEVEQVVEDASSSTCPSLLVYNALAQGCLDYRTSWAWQHVLLEQRLALRRRQQQAAQNHKVDDDVVLLFEHAPVYTLGRGADENHVTFLQSATADDHRRVALSRKTRRGARLSLDRQQQQAICDNYHHDNQQATAVQTLVDQVQHTCTPVMAPNGVPIYRVERGGEVTWHGPGQLVVYPLLDLRAGSNVQADLHWFLRQVEQVIILTLQAYGIDDAVRDDINTGVWVQQRKIAAVGVAASRWITTHGFALNVQPDLSYFDTSIILPCGIEERGVTSMAQVLYERCGNDCDVPTVTQVAQVVVEKMEQVFGVTTVRQPM